jgi:transcriptional accessory protein Tex/SPT6
VKGIGETTFRNCAGFLRVYPPIRGGGSSSSDGDNLFNPLDATNVHPERYSLALSFLREVCRQLQKPSFDDRVIRQLLFSEELQSLLVDFSDSSWTTVAKACSTSQLPVDVSEIKQLGAWLSAAEFCGDAYFSSIASSKDPGSRGIRANRGQPPILKAISTLSAHASESEESSGIGGDSATRKSRKNKRDIDNNVNEDSETRNSSAKRLKIGLQVGDECLGTVRNVTAFGVFLDIGASRDGLLHTSEFLSNKFKKKAGKSIGGAIANSQSIPLVIGATVRVKVKSIDVERDRISLTQIDI